MQHRIAVAYFWLLAIDGALSREHTRTYICHVVLVIDTRQIRTTTIVVVTFPVLFLGY